MDFEKFQGIVEMDEWYSIYFEHGKRKLEGLTLWKRSSSSKKRGISNK